MTEKHTDVLGLAPYGAAINTAVKKSFKGIEGFLKSVCAPALDEVGLMLKDQVRYWRLCNILKILDKAQGKLELTGEQFQIQAHPRVALAIIEHGSVIDNEEVQELWAGLFASSCSKDGQDDENLIFVDLLKQLTTAEAKILKFACENSRKIIHTNGLITSDELYCDCKDLFSISGINDIHRLDRELDHLRSMELLHAISGGISTDSIEPVVADITPSSLALNLYVRGQGFSASIAEYWKDSVKTEKEVDDEVLAKLERRKQEEMHAQKRNLS